MGHTARVAAGEAAESVAQIALVQRVHSTINRTGFANRPVQQVAWTNPEVIYSSRIDVTATDQVRPGATEKVLESVRDQQRGGI